MLYYPVILGLCLKDSHHKGRHGNSIILKLIPYQSFKKWLEKYQKKLKYILLLQEKKYLAVPSSNRKNPASRDLTDAAELHGGLTDFL